MLLPDKFVKEWPSVLFLLFWSGGNMALFLTTFFQYMFQLQFFYLSSILGVSICVSRGAASALNFNLALILLPVCRNLISLLRRSCLFGSSQCSRTKVVCRQLDRNIFFHKLCAYAICFWTALHFIGHTFNFKRYIYAASLPAEPRGVLIQELSELPVLPNGTWLNPIRTNHTDQMKELWSCLAGSTGSIATIILIVMVSSSTEVIRRNCFEIFWYTHHLFVVFFALIIVHGFGGVVRQQTNMDKHDVLKCRNDSAHWGEIEGCDIPQFSSDEHDTWMWVIGPICLYALECCIRFVNRVRKVEIVKTINHPSKVIEIRMRRRGFKMRAGQYIFINCPSVSRFEWHPFTLTSAPEDDYFSVHIRLLGDWTNSFAEIMNKDETKKPRISVDGPFGTCSEDVFRYKVAILVGAGIGVTPFASILKHIWRRYTVPGTEPAYLKKIYFYWVSPDCKSFEWFRENLRDLEESMLEQGSTDFIQIRMYWTRGWTEDQSKLAINSIDAEFDPLTNLRSKPHFGRPNWDLIFKNKATIHKNEQIGVFFCGPKTMSRSLDLVCSRYSSHLPGRTQFIFNKENF